MNIIEITVGAATSFNHPYESYANFKPSVTIKATVEPGQDGAFVARELQRRAAVLVQEEKVRILRDCKLVNLEVMLRQSADLLAETETELAEKDAKVKAGDMHESYLDYPRERIASLKAQIASLQKDIEAAGQA